MSRLDQRILFCLLACLLLVPLANAELATETQAVEDEQTTQFLRLSRDEDRKPLALQVSIIRYVPRNQGSGPEYVDLISAVHVAEKDYFADLNKRFKDYDAVLYELVAPENTRLPQGGGSQDPSMLSRVQIGMKSALGLSFQLEEIDYTAENLVHADMSPEQFSQSMDEKGESMLGMLARLWVAGMQQSATSSGALTDIKLMMALFSSNRERALKRVAAEQFADMETVLDGIGGEEGSTLITERNKKALEVLKREIANDKQRIAIFYGAGHMKDMGARLEIDFGLVPTTEIWLDAWDLTQ